MMLDYTAPRRGSRHGIDRNTWLRDSAQYVPRGQELPQTKLLDIDVIDIRSAKRQRDGLMKHIRENLSNKALAARYGVHERTIEKVLARETHSDLA